MPPLMADARITGLVLAAVVAVGGAAHARQARAPAGRIAYVHAGNIYTVRPDGKERRQLTRSGKDASPAWSRDGSTLAFVPRGGWSPDGTMVVYEKDGWIRVAAVREQKTRKVVRGHSPQWSMR
jgi:hypothetical protein